VAQSDDIADDEILLRHVPGGTLWQAPGPRITSANFQLRKDRPETGVSVTRLAITSAARLLRLVGGDPAAGSRVGAAKVGDIRALGLCVVARPVADDPGHAEIQSGAASLDEHLTRRKRANLFRLLPESPIG
jgi:hypothetical protein